MKSSRVRFGVSSLAAAGASLLAASAYADTTPSPTAKCETTLACSSGQASLKAQSRDRLTTSVDTGWLPSCGVADPNNDHCGSKPLQFRANIAFDAVGDETQSLYEIDMEKGAVLDVTWPDKDALTVKLSSGKQTDGKISVSYTLVPDVSVYLNVSLGPLKLSKQFDYDATTLLNLIPGANFNYLASGSAGFAPWGLDGGQLVVKGPDLSTSELFSMPLESLPLISDYATGTLAVSATTSPTFAYKTTKVTLTGVTDPLASAGASAKIKYSNADAIDLEADVEGQLSFSGTMEVLPVIDATLPDFGNLHLNLPISVGAKKDYTNEGSPIAIAFGKRAIHVPLPNVAVPADEVDFGTIKTGSDAQKTISIANTGELGAMLNVESSDPRFTIDAGQIKMDPKSKHDVVVRFAPSHDGDATATITVKSNDPDAPVQTFTVKGSASAAAAPGGSGSSDGPPDPKPSDSSGCACRVTSPDTSSTSGAGLLALGVAAFVRRRRKG